MSRHQNRRVMNQLPKRSPPFCEGTKDEGSEYLEGVLGHNNLPINPLQGVKLATLFSQSKCVLTKITSSSRFAYYAIDRNSRITS